MAGGSRERNEEGVAAKRQRRNPCFDDIMHLEKLQISSKQSAIKKEERALKHYMVKQKKTGYLNVGTNTSQALASLQSLESSSIRSHESTKLNVDLSFKEDINDLTFSKNQPRRTAKISMQQADEKAEQPNSLPSCTKEKRQPTAKTDRVSLVPKEYKYFSYQLDATPENEYSGRHGTDSAKDDAFKQKLIQKLRLQVEREAQVKIMAAASQSKSIGQTSQAQSKSQQQVINKALLRSQLSSSKRVELMSANRDERPSPDAPAQLRVDSAQILIQENDQQYQDDRSVPLREVPSPSLASMIRECQMRMSHSSRNKQSPATYSSQQILQRPIVGSSFGCRRVSAQSAKEQDQQVEMAMPLAKQISLVTRKKKEIGKSQNLETAKDSKHPDEAIQNIKVNVSDSKLHKAQPKTSFCQQSLQDHQRSAASPQQRSRKEVLLQRHTLTQVPCKSHTSRKHIAVQGAVSQEKLKVLNRNLRNFKRDKEQTRLMPITPQQATKSTSSLRLTSDPAGVFKEPTADVLNGIYLRKSALCLQERLQRRFSPAKDPTGIQKDIQKAINRIASMRIGCDSSTLGHEPTPDQLTEQLESFLRPVEHIFVELRPKKTVTAATNKTPSITNLNFFGQNKNMVDKSRGGALQEERSQRVGPPANRASQAFSIQRMKKLLNPEMALVDQATSHLQKVHDNINQQHLKLRVVPTRNRVSQPRQKSLGSQNRQTSSRRNEAGIERNNSLTIRASSDFVDPIVAQAAKTSTESWLYATKEVILDQPFDEEQAQIVRQQQQVKDYVKLRERLEKPWREYVRQSNAFKEYVHLEERQRELHKKVSQTQSQPQRQQQSVLSCGSRANPEQVVAQSSFVDGHELQEGSSSSKESSRENPSALTYQQGRTESHSSLCAPIYDSQAILKKQKPIQVKIRFTSVYEDKNAKMGGQRAQPVLKKMKTKNEMMQRDISFLKAIKSLDLK